LKTQTATVICSKISRDDPLEHALTPAIKPHVRRFREALEMKGDFWPIPRPGRPAEHIYGASYNDRIAFYANPVHTRPQIEFWWLKDKPAWTRGNQVRSDPFNCYGRLLPRRDKLVNFKDNSNVVHDRRVTKCSENASRMYPVPRFSWRGPNTYIIAASLRDYRDNLHVRRKAAEEDQEWLGLARLGVSASLAFWNWGPDSMEGPKENVFAE
jgi:hypothetical protein